MKLISFVLSAAILVTACNDSGWTNAQKQSFLKTCNDGMAGNVEDATAKKICNCALEKTMKKYPNYAEADRKGTSEQGAEIGRQCAEDVMTGKNGEEKGGMLGGDEEWSSEDKQKFMNTCVQNAMNAGADQQTSTEHCQCTLKKIEKKYKSYAEADRKMTKAEVDAIEQECIQERGKNNQDNN